MLSLIKVKWDILENYFIFNEIWEILKYLEQVIIFKLFNIIIFEDRMSFGIRVIILMLRGSVWLFLQLLFGVNKILWLLYFILL